MKRSTTFIQLVLPFVLFVIQSYDGQAQLRLLRDIYPGSQGSIPQLFTALGNNTLFFARDDVHGQQLWKSDGTPGGTAMVKALFPSPPGILNAQSIVSYKNQLIFGGAGPDGQYLIRTDGTDGGTAGINVSNMVQTYLPPSNLMVAGNIVFFTEIINGPNGANSELWKTDGTEAGTQLVKDLAPGDRAEIILLGSINGTIYFRGYTLTEGYELWKSDGTSAGTVMVKNIQPGPNSGFPGTALIIAGNTLYFGGDDGVYGTELWKSDGTDAGTVMVKDINPGPASGGGGPLLTVNGTVFLTGNDGVHGNELWKTDGTAAGTVMLKDITPSSGDNVFSGPQMWPTPFNNNLIFVDDDGVHGQELWKSDGTAAGTVMIKDVNPNGSSYPYSGYSGLTGNKLVFAADDGTHGANLWITDGTEAGTNFVKDLSQGTGYTDFGSLNFLSDNHYVFFERADPITGIYGIWETDGTAGGTVPVYTDAGVNSFFVNAGFIYANISDPTLGQEPYAGSVIPQKQDQTITFDTLAAKTYGDTVFTLTATASSGLPVSYTSSDPTIAIIVGGNRVQILKAGTVTITASQAGALGFNSAPDVTQSLVINKAQLVITANHKRKLIGQPNPPLDATYTGFVNGDDATVLTTPVTITTTADINSPLGDYPIVPSGATADSYNITFVNGRLHVALLPLIPQTITFNPLPVKQSSDADFDPGAVASSGLPVVYTTSNTNVAVVVNGKIHITGAGTVNITASQPGDDNYDVAPSITQILTVNISSQTINFGVPGAKTYGDPVFDAGATASSGLPVTYTSSDDKAAVITSDNKIRITGAGTVVITAKQAGNNSYTAASDVAQSLIVGKAGLTIRAEDKTKVQGELNPRLTMTFTGFVNNEDVTVFTTPIGITTPAATSSMPGEYPILLSGAMTTNYDVHLVNGRLTVTPALPGHNTLVAWFSSSSVLQVTLYADPAQKAVLQLLDARGGILLRQEVQAAKGLNSYTIPCGILSAGAYILQAMGEQLKLDKKLLKSNQ